MNVFLTLPAIMFALLLSPCAEAQESWADSYEVDGKCYCVTSGGGAMDHGIADVVVDGKTVEEICELLGEGPTEGRIYYNDIQCGNGPANDAADETVCPGIPSEGNDSGPDCNAKGPMWDTTDLGTEAGDTMEEPVADDGTGGDTMEEPDAPEVEVEENDTTTVSGEVEGGTVTTAADEEPCDCECDCDLTLDPNDPFGTSTGTVGSDCTAINYGNTVQYVCR